MKIRNVAASAALAAVIAGAGAPAFAAEGAAPEAPKASDAATTAPEAPAGDDQSGANANGSTDQSSEQDLGPILKGVSPLLDILAPLVEQGSSADDATNAPQPETENGEPAATESVAPCPPRRRPTSPPASWPWSAW